MRGVSRTHKWSLVSDDRNRTGIGRVSAVYRGVDLFYRTLPLHLMFYFMTLLLLRLTIILRRVNDLCIVVKLKRRNEMRQRQIVRQGIGSYLKFFSLIWFGL